jgi:hypothetical protein
LSGRPECCATGGRVVTFGEIENDTGTGGWFTPARKSPPEQSGTSDGFGSGAAAFRGGGPDRRDPRGPGDGGAWREIPARGATAANRWAEVTRGGTPVGDIRALGGDQGHAADGSHGQRGGGFGETVPEGIPFRGARPIDVSAPRNPPATGRSPAYSAHSAAASGAPGTGQRRSETGALRKIRESGAIRAIMDTGAMQTLMDTTAMQVLRERYAGKGRVIAIVGVCFWAVLAAAAILLVVTHGG